MLWKILADAVMVFHLSVMLFFLVSAVLLAAGVFRGRRNWQYFYYGLVALVLGLRIGDWVGVLKECSLTDLEYMLRRLYDPTESWARSRSLLATVIFNLTGVEVPEFVFTVVWGVLTAVIIVSLIVRKK